MKTQYSAPAGRGWLKYGLYVGLASSLVLSAEAQSTASSEDADDTVVLNEFTVTGSLIPMTETAAEAKAIPVTRIDATNLIETPALSLGEVLQNMNVSNGGAIPISNNATGFTPAASSVSMRGLGPEATLVLINGRRVANYPIGAGGTSAFVDLNTIPTDSVESVEILRDGGTAIYGADAVAGVVNIRLKNNLRGVITSFEKGFSTHGDYEETNASIAFGAGNETTSITGVFSYFTNTEIYNRDREYSKLPPFLSSNASPINISGLRRQVVAEARGQGWDTVLDRGAGVDSSSQFPYGDGGATFDTQVVVDDEGNVLNTGFLNLTTGPADAKDQSPLPGNSNDRNDGTLPATDYLIRNALWDSIGFGVASRYNYNESSVSFPEGSRVGATVGMEHRISDEVVVYGNFMYSRNRYINQLAPSATGAFARPGATQLIIPARTSTPIPFVVPDNDPNLPAELPELDQRVWVTASEAGLPANTSIAQAESIRGLNPVTDRLAPQGAYNPWNPFNEDISGSSSFRMAEFGNRIFRTTNEALLFDIGLKGRINNKFNYDFGYRNSNVTTKDDDSVVSASKFNQIVNQADPIFQPGGIFEGMAAYNPFGYYKNPIEGNFPLVEYASIRTQGTAKTSNNNLWLDINTADLFELPTGSVGAAVGVDYRRESLEEHPDTAARFGDIVGSSPSGNGTVADREIASAYASVRVPLANPDMDLPGIYSMSIEGALRYEDFKTSNRDTWSPKLFLKYLPIEEVAIRASWGTGYREPSMYELFGGTTQALQNIRNPRTGVVEPEVPILRNGNPDLEGEETTSANIGIVWTPEWRVLKGFTFGVDAWKITREGYVNLPSASETIEAWESGNPLPNTFVIFDPATDRLVQVGRTFQNVNEFDVRGIDFAIGYVYASDNLGTFNFDLGGTWFERYSFDGENLVGQATSDESNDGYLEWKASARLAWRYKGFHIAISPRYIDGFTDYTYDADFNVVERQVESRILTDVYMSYDIGSLSMIKAQEWLNDATVYVKIRNVLDTDPPYANGYFGNSVGYPGFLYDSRGRVITAGFELKF